MDYIRTSDTRTFTSTVNRQCISVFILDDNLIESNEFLFVSLSSEDNAFLVNEGRDVARVTIQDDDGKSVQ